MEQKGKYMDVEDAAGPGGLLLMGRDAGPSFMKRGLYLDSTHVRSGDLEGISRKSHCPGFCPLRCLSGNHPFPVQPAGKPVSYGQNVGRPHKRWVITSCPLSPSVLFSNPLHRHRASPLFTNARWSPGQDLRPPLHLPPPEMKSVHRGIQDSSKINPPKKDHL